MSRFCALASAFARDSRGATAIEYGLVAALVSISIIAAATSIGQSVVAIFVKAAASL